MHFELDRRLAPEELADLEDAVRSVLADVRRVVRDFPQLRERVESRRSSVARAGAARYDEDEVAEVVAFLEWLARRQLHLPRRARLRAGRRRPARRAGLRARPARRRGALGLRQARGGRVARPEPARAGAGRRAAAGLQDQPHVAGAPPRAHGLRRRPPRRRRRRDRRRGAAASASSRPRPTPSPRSETPAPAPQAAADPRQRGPDRRLARLQGRRLALRVLPQGRALRRAHRRPARRGRRALGLQAEQGRVLGRRDAGRAHRVDHRRAAQGRLRRGAAGAPARLPAPALRRQHGRRPRGARPRATACACTSPIHRAQGGLPELSRRDVEAEILELARTWDDRARDELVARHGEERGRVLAKRWTARLPDSYKAAVDPAAAADDIALLRAPVHRRRGLPRRPAQRARRARRASGCTASATRSSSPRPCRRSSTSACAWSRSAPRGCSAATGRCGCRTSASSARPTSRSTSTSAASASRSASRPSGAARRSRTR